MKSPKPRNSVTRVALYVRVSTVRQAEHDLSIPDQIRQGEAFCERKGWELVQSFTEPGASGTDERRPVFQEMIDLACGPDRPFDVILTHSFSRFFRDAMLFEIYARRLKKAGAELVSMTQEVNDDPSSQFMRKVVVLFDEYSSQENAKHVRRAMRENAKQGFWNGSKPPFGYRTEEAGRRGDKVKKVLAVDPTEASVVRQIFDLYLGADGAAMGVKAIATSLNQRGLMLRGKRFSIATVYAILTRTAYHGLHYFDRRDSRTGLWKDRAEWVPTRVPTIIEEDVFDRVQATLKARNPKVTPSRVVTGPTLLTGLAHCATCGGGMTLRTGKSGRYRYYTCGRQATQGKCGCKGRSMPMDKLDHLIVEHMADKLFATDRLMHLLKEYLDRSVTAQSGRREKLRLLKAEGTETEGRLRKLFTLVETGMMTPDDPILGERVAQIRLQRQETEDRITLLERELNAQAYQLTPDTIAAFGTLLREQLKNGSVEFRKAYLNLFIDRIEVDDTEVRIRGPVSALAGAASGKLPKPSDAVPSYVREWRTRRDSNSRPLPSEGSALSS